MINERQSVEKSVVSFRDVTVSFRGASAIFSPLSFDLKAGQTLALLGPNGSGKSTILRMILGYVSSNEGDIAVGPALNRISFIPQDYRKALFPWLSMARHVRLYSQGADGFESQVFQRLGNQFGLAIDDKVPLSRLSGGEQQLLLLNLALSRNVRLYLLDEPFSAVDLRRRGVALSCTKDRLAERASAAILVTHHIEDAAVLADSAVVLPGSPRVSPIFIAKTEGEDFQTKIKEAFHAFSS